MKKAQADIKHLYVHVPFCKTICGYCDFCHLVYQRPLVKRWLNELKNEIEATQVGGNLQTIYIGGGTPSCLHYDEIEELLMLLQPYSYQLIEYTIEVNPETVTKDLIVLLRRYGINRISIGIQSAIDQELKLLRRNHDFAAVKQAIAVIKEAGINNISADLMYSLPGQTMNSFKTSLTAVGKLGVKHISLYSLTIEPGTYFAHRGYKPLDEEIEADMYEMADKLLQSYGFDHYEVANYAQSGYESKHNIGYWEYDDFYGIGMGASGKEGLIRYDNSRSLTDYLNGNHRAVTIPLSDDDAMFENVMMSLRMSKGLDLEQFKKRYGRDFRSVYHEPYQKHRAELIEENGRIRVKNLALLNELLLDFLK